MSKRFVKLEMGNDWGTDYFSLPGKSKRGTFQTCSYQECAIKFKGGEILRVRWPDGKESNAVVTMKRKFSRISDMGHDYDHESETPALAATINGVDTVIPLDAVKVRIDTLPNNGKAQTEKEKADRSAALDRCASQARARAIARRTK